MPSPSLEALLQPIRPDAPAGDDLAFSPAFDAIAEQRREDDPTLAQGEWVTELKVADWPGVLRDCDALLRTTTKDLRVAGWWADAAARLRGLDGLADGLRLSAELLARFWDHLHPLPEGGEAEERIGNLAWLLARVEALAWAAPVVQVGRHRLGLREVEATRQRAQDPSAPTAAGERPMHDERPTLAAVHRAVAQAGSSAFDAQLAAMQAARDALQALQTEVDARLGLEGPGFAAARKALEDAHDALKRLGRDSGLGSTLSARAGDGHGGAPEPGRPHHVDPADTADAAQVSDAPRAGPLRSRAQALAQLHEVAAYFRRTEPHSPVAYLAEKAARWGELPLHAWLRQVVQDDATLARLDDMLGVDPTP
jgi:type VI secretion system protein ImpA